MRKFITLTLLICILGFSGSAWAGWIIEQSAEGMDSTMYIQDNKMRNESGMDVTTIFDIDKGLIYFIIPEKKLYAEAKPEEMAKQSDDMMGDMMKQMEQQLKNMPEQQKKMIMEQMKSQMAAQKQQKGDPKPAPKIKIIKTSVKEKIAGYSTRKYQVMADGKLVQESWIADDINIGKEIDLDKMEDMMSKMDMGGEQMSYRTDKAVIGLMRKGYPLKEFYSDMDMTTITKKVTKAKISSDKFKVPAGYRKGTFSEVMLGQ